MTRAWIGAAIGGVVGTALWAAIAVFAELEIGWIAWGVGWLVGFCALRAAPDEANIGTGVMAAGVAVLAVAAGKYVAVTIAVDQFVTEAELPGEAFGDELAISYIADDVALELEQAGQTLEWPPLTGGDFPDEQAEYPGEVWSEAAQRWDALGPDERLAYKDELRARRRAELAEYGAEVRREGFAASFSPMDILFLTLAIATAFRLGSGSSQGGRAAA